NVVAKDKREVARVYLGIAIMHADKLHVIPVIDRPDNLEYELSAGLLRVTKEHQPTIGWWGPTASGGEVAESGAGQYETVHRQLEQRYTVRTITHDGASVSTKELQALLLVAPKNFTAAQAGAVERYLAEGGKVVALVDRMAVDPRTLTATAVTSGLESLFAKYGVTLNADLVADASSAYAAFGGGTMTIYHPIVARLEQLTFPWVSSLTLADPLPEGLTATALVRSSKQSGLTTEEPPFRVDPDTGMGLLPAMPSPERPLAVVVSGALSGGTSGQLLVVGTSRIIEDRTARQFVDGVIFFENAVDYVALGEQLIGIRSRQVTARPIAPLSDTGRAAIKYLNTFGVPIMVIVAGLLGLVWRRARRRALRIAYNLPS
ncbi:MAG: GldG family protein, partial [Deltaproteobacteria bacterium]|nr:GldG family protein [Deltaproteobacteria bacterium]